MNVTSIAPSSASLDKDPITGLDMNRKTGNRTLGADDFMKILMTQLSAQDPMNPMKDTEFIAQMANFSSLEQMRTLSQSFTAYSSSQQMATAPLYLGCDVTVKDPSGPNGEIKGTVQSVTVKDGKPALVIDGKTYNPDLITSIALPPKPLTPSTALDQSPDISNNTNTSQTTN
jgi:flagellar basal-body rod modification protein FlgD